MTVSDQQLQEWLNRFARWFPGSVDSIWPRESQRRTNYEPKKDEAAMSQSLRIREVSPTTIGPGNRPTRWNSSQ
jgi:hypothetical protein